MTLPSSSLNHLPFEAVPGLDDLLAPVGKTTFFETHWENEPLHIKRNDPDYFASLISMADLDQLLGYLPAEKQIRIVSANEDGTASIQSQPAGMGNMASFYDLFFKGNTILIDGIQDHWEPIAKMHLQLAHDLDAEAVSNLYVTPQNARAFKRHWDDHDVWVLQISGEKRWFLYDGGPHLPSSGNKSKLLSQGADGPLAPSRELLIQPGDTLYLPRGTWHRAETEACASLHLTVGVVGRTWEHLFTAAVSKLAEDHMALRQSLPVGWQWQRERLKAQLPAVAVVLKGLFEAAILEKGRRRVAADFLANLAVPPSNMFPQLQKLDSLNLDTVLVRRAGKLLLVDRESQMVKLFFPGFYQGGPEKLEWALQFIANTPRFRPRDIPGWYAPQEKLTLVKHLVRKGFLRMQES